MRNRSRIEGYECQCEFRLPAGIGGIRASGSPRRTTAGLEWNLGVLAPYGHAESSNRGEDAHW